ncbi:MAG: hypothetical protein Q8Q60_02270 [Candidatus Chromulinivorax sp.]|nr:hypothetical protein [Candidatus Chromulinivorax sp.]
MKIIKNLLLCAVAVIAQANVCMADTPQEDVEKNHQVIEDQKSNEVVESDEVVENTPYITKSTMLTIAAGMFVVAVGLKSVADYYEVFPSGLGELFFGQSPIQPSDNDESVHLQLKPSQTVTDEQEQVIIGESDILQVDKPVDDWGAQYEREAKAEEIYRAAKKHTRGLPELIVEGSVTTNEASVAENVTKVRSKTRGKSLESLIAERKEQRVNAVVDSLTDAICDELVEEIIQLEQLVDAAVDSVTDAICDELEKEAKEKDQSQRSTARDLFEMMRKK